MNFFTKDKAKFTVVTLVAFGLYQIIPPTFNAAKTVFNWGIQYNSVQAAITDHSLKIKSNSTRIDNAEKEIRSWRAVWCISELSKKQIIPAVANACEDWIREGL
jgi:hypothetical protein